MTLLGFVDYFLRLQHFLDADRKQPLEVWINAVRGTCFLPFFRPSRVAAFPRLPFPFPLTLRHSLTKLIRQVFEEIAKFIFSSPSHPRRGCIKGRSGEKEEIDGVSLRQLGEASSLGFI